MFYLVSKLFAFFLMPIGIILSLILSMIICKNRTKTKRLGYLTILLTYLFSSPVLVNQLALYWEVPQKDIREIENYDVGILLTGGMLNSYLPFPHNLNLKTSGDRLWQTLHLYKEGKIKNIIISGGETALLNKNIKTEIDYAKIFLVQNGVNPNEIFLDHASKNTNENAINSSKILNESFEEKSILLITSAFHMKRAIACYEKRGVNASSFPVNFLSFHNKPDLLDYFPDANAFQTSSQILREIIGMAVYKIMGYA